MKPVHHFVQNFFPGVPMLPKMLTKNVNKENVNKKILHKMMHWFHGAQTANPEELTVNTLKSLTFFV